MVAKNGASRLYIADSTRYGHEGSKGPQAYTFVQNPLWNEFIFEIYP